MGNVEFYIENFIFIQRDAFGFFLEAAEICKVSSRCDPIRTSFERTSLTDQSGPPVVLREVLWS